jgi:transcriptional regulator with XRE-family HTH domain
MGFGAAVREKRKERGLTLEQLSERSNVTPNYLGRVENEKVDPSLSIVLAIAAALRASLGDLTGDGRTERGGASAASARKVGRALRLDTREVAALYESLPLDVQEALLPMLRAIADRIAKGRRGPK